MGLVAAGFLGVSAAAQARPTIYVIPPDGSFATPEGGAVGLYVPGTGGTVSRARAIAALRRGTVESDFGTPGGKILVDLVFGFRCSRSEPAVYVSLPPPGEHPNTKRYGVMIVGAGYHGILTSDSTRIRGLVSIADIAPTAVALQEGRSPPIRSEPDRDARADLRALDTRLTRVHHDRGWVVVTVVLTIIALAAFAPRAAGIGGAAAMTASLLLSWAGATRFALVIAAMAALTIALAVAGSLRRRLVPIVVAAFLAAFTIVLAVDPELNSLAVLGARPDGGGRFYGVGNQVETLLLPPVLVAVAIGGLRWLLPLAALALVAIGWSKAGADGGGVLVFATALGVLGLRLRGLTLTPRRLALVGVAVLVVALAFVGLDAVLGGSSHVTRAVGSGPDSLLGSLGHRLHLSWLSATDHWYRILIFLSCLAAIVLMGTMRPRRATVDALLAGLAVSLLVNDTPVDVIGLGALGCLVLVRWESVDSRPMRLRAFTAAAALAVLTLALAGCGDRGDRPPGGGHGRRNGEGRGSREGDLPQPGLRFVSHLQARRLGRVGDDRARPRQAAGLRKGGEPAARAFVHESIVNPDKYVEKGFPKGVMPKSYTEPAGERPQSPRRLPDEAAGLNLPQDFPREVDAVACDLDRTLIGEDAVLRPRTRAAIVRTLSAGIHVVLVTGRMFQSVRRYALEAGIEDPVVCYQGAVVAEPISGRWLRHVPIPLELARETIAALNEEGVGLNCYVDDELYVAEVTPEARRYADFQDLELHPVGDLLDWLDRPPTKLVVIGDPEPLDGLKQRMLDRFEGRLYISKSLPYFLEFASPDVTKAAGLEFLAEQLGFARERTLAFGDGENDIELVDWAGYGVAVENAHDLVKEVADFVCPSVDEEGVAQVLEAYLDSRT